MLFNEFCKNCEEITSSKGKLKKDCLRNFFEKCRRKALEDESFIMFSVIRLMLSQADRSRGPFGVKEITLAKLYTKTLCLPIEGADAQRLLNYRVPKSAFSVSKDFAEVVYNVLRRRCPNTGSNITITDVNIFLDTFANSYSTKKTDERINLLRVFLMKMSALEQKWLIRILLRSGKLNGLNENLVLSTYHPDAKELYDVSHDLEKVCQTLVDPFSRSLGKEITLFKAFRPMLADRIKISKFLNKMNNHPFYAETKLDGERIQIHKQAKKYGYYSRRGFDYSSYFGPDPSSGNLSNRLDECFHSWVENCILDGEMVAWNVKGSFIISKGGNIDVKSLSQTGSIVPCFFVFDILQVNDEVVAKISYQERLKLLESAIKAKESVIQFPSRKLVSSETEVTQLLNAAIDQREEGIVLKDPNSIYKPNDRKGGWVKVKPEYVDSLVDDLDLIILGGYHGQGRKRDLISMFLVGVALPISENGKPRQEFYSFARVGSGFSDSQLLELLHKLNPHWQKWDKNAPPSMIHCGKEKPDVWIDPKQSAILQIKASEIVASNSYQTGCTLRFPRVQRLREDRAWDSAMTLEELKTLKGKSAGKLAIRHLSTQEEVPTSKRRKLAASSVEVAPQFLPADTSDVKIVSTCFSGKVICVLNGTESLSKQDLERKIVSGGGEIAQHPGNSTFSVVAANEDIRAKSYKGKQKWDIVYPSWILRCLALNRLVAYRPEELMFVSQATMKVMEKDYDRYGNSLKEATATADVSSILQRVQELDHPSPLHVAEIADIEFEIFGQVNQYGIFRTCLVYIDNVKSPTAPPFFGEIDIISLDLRVYGAAISDSIDNQVTHVVCDPVRNPERVNYWNEKNARRETKFHLVRLEWVTDSINKGSLVDEFAYIPELSLY